MSENSNFHMTYPDQLSDIPPIMKLPVTGDEVFANLCHPFEIDGGMWSFSDVVHTKLGRSVYIQQCIYTHSTMTPPVT